MKYVGKVKNRAGTGTYHAYKAIKDGADGGIDWSRYGSGDDDGGSDLPSSDATTAATTAPTPDDEPLPF